MNIHIFDGKLHESIAPFRADLLRVQGYSTEQRANFLQELYVSLAPHLSAQCQRILQIVIAADRSAANYDSSNNVRADDVLLLIAELKVNAQDLGVIFQEQLQDMAGGMCPQGRATRMVQIYLGTAC